MKLFSPAGSAESDMYLRLAAYGDQDTLEKDLLAARREIEKAYYNFQNASDPDLIDAYIYAGNAAWKRYRFLLRQAKNIS